MVPINKEAVTQATESTQELLLILIDTAKDLPRHVEDAEKVLNGIDFHGRRYLQNLEETITILRNLLIAYDEEEYWKTQPLIDSSRLLARERDVLIKKRGKAIRKARITNAKEKHN